MISLAGVRKYILLNTLHVNMDPVCVCVCVCVCARIHACVCACMFLCVCNNFISLNLVE